MNVSLSSFLGTLKHGRLFDLAREPSDLSELLTLLCVGHTYRISARTYHCAKNHPRSVRLVLGHFCLRDSEQPGVPLFWWEPLGSPALRQKPEHNYYVRPLTEEEQDRLRQWVGPVPPESGRMNVVIPLRHGPYLLKELARGELFVLTDGTFAEVAQRQPKEGDQARVWLKAGSDEANLTLMSGETAVFAVSEGQAQRLERKRGAPSPASRATGAKPTRDVPWTKVQLQDLKPVKSTTTIDSDVLWAELQGACSENDLSKAAYLAQELLQHLREGAAPPRMDQSDELTASSTEQTRREVAIETCEQLLERQERAKQRQAERKT